MIIDCFNHLKDEASLAQQLAILRQSVGYIELFGPRLAKGLGMTEEEARVLPETDLGLLPVLLSYVREHALSDAAIVKEMSQASIDYTIVHNEDLGPDSEVEPLPLDYWESLPERFSGESEGFGWRPSVPATRTPG